jgi:hypothetical protein
VLTGAQFQDAIIQGVGKMLVSIVQDTIHRPGSLPGGDSEADAGPTASWTVPTCGGVPRESTPAEPDSTIRSRMLKLGDGTLLHLTGCEIPDPPAVSFVDDIPRLNGMWDDHTEHWQGQSVIMIHGHPIAIEYWPLLYRYGGEHQWKGTKSRWTDYRVCFPSPLIRPIIGPLLTHIFLRAPGHYPVLSSGQP